MPPSPDQQKYADYCLGELTQPQVSLTLPDDVKIFPRSSKNVFSDMTEQIFSKLTKEIYDLLKLRELLEFEVKKYRKWTDPVYFVKFMLLRRHKVFFST